jgi:anti-sigma regulatory factor (Ser/Thr protein kinase)
LFALKRRPGPPTLAAEGGAGAPPTKGTGMSRNHLQNATQWITGAARQHGEALAPIVMERLGLGQRAARALLTRLVAAQWLVREGPLRRPVYRPGVLRQGVQRYGLSGLHEDLPWQRDFAPLLELPPNVARLAQHAFSELLNNAVDHSGGTQVTVSLRQTAMHLQLLVSDNGCGVFERIQQRFDIAEPALAMLELSKGKLTTAPERHSGHGLFFTSRLADVFDLHANAAAFQFRGGQHRGWFAGKPMARQGTSVYLAIALDTPRTLDDVLRAHSADGAGYAFDTTMVPLGLMTGRHTGLESRAQAKRVVSRLQRFRRAEVDFTGIVDVGHGFADELFRVFPREHPSLELVPVGMTPRVAAMVDSVRSALA